MDSGKTEVQNYDSVVVSTEQKIRLLELKLNGLRKSYAALRKERNHLLLERNHLLLLTRRAASKLADTGELLFNFKYKTHSIKHEIACYHDDIHEYLEQIDNRTNRR